MAYTSTNLNCFTEAPLASGLKFWTYETTDAIGTVLGAGYITDATKKRVAKGDLVFVVNTTSATFFLTQVLSVSSGAATLEMAASPMAEQLVSTALTTVGAGTITAAGIVGGYTSRGGTQSGSAFTDTTATADLIVAAMDNPGVGRAFEYVYVNGTDAVATITGGTGVTVSGVTIVPPLSVARFLVTYSAASTVTMVGVGLAGYGGGPGALAPHKFTSISAGNGTFSAGDIEGAAFTVLATSGATAMTTRTAAQMLAGIPNAGIGSKYVLRVYNTNGGTLTITGGTGVTVTGTATIATNVWREYLVTFTSATALTMQNIGAGNAT